MEIGKDYKVNNPAIFKQVSIDVDTGNTFHYIFTGVCGCGKTYLAEQIAKHYPNTKIITAQEAYQKYRYAINLNTADQATELRKSIHCMRGRDDLLILDDLGAEKPRTEASRAFMESILEDRYEWIRKGFGGSTIITTNLTSEKLAEFYGDRVLDRLQEMFTIMKFRPYSFRSLKRKIIEG
jgi:DNA replication protein DnaC